jgi:hypothetical protein
VASAQPVVVQFRELAVSAHHGMDDVFFPISLVQANPGRTQDRFEAIRPGFGGFYLPLARNNSAPQNLVQNWIIRGDVFLGQRSSPVSRCVGRQQNPGTRMGTEAVQ